jgi:hypothetical protein
MNNDDPIFAVIEEVLGPILAVQAQKWVERATENRRRKVQVFERLMATRATPIAPEHVQALNTIELVFNKGWFLSPKTKENEKAVITEWRAYLDNLNHGPYSKENPNPDPSIVTAWQERCADSFVELMKAMSRALRYDVDSVQLRRGVYHPQGHADMETAFNEIRQNLARVLSGQQPIPMKVVGFPVDPAIAARQAELSGLLVKALTGEGALHVATKDDGNDAAPKEDGKIA